MRCLFYLWALNDILRVTNQKDSIGKASQTETHTKKEDTTPDAEDKQKTDTLLIKKSGENNGPLDHGYEQLPEVPSELNCSSESDE